MINKAQEFWDKQAKKFDSNQGQFEPANQVIVSGTKEYLDKNDITLDFGCATGIKTLALADSVRQIHGVDFSGAMINEALVRKSKSGLSTVSFKQGSIFDNTLEEASFDKIIAYSIVHLLEDADKAIQRINDLLKPGGLFISETACFKDKMDFKTRVTFAPIFLMERLGAFPLHLNMYTFADTEQQITGHGFKIVRSEKMFFNGMTISFIVAEKS
jgi:ubiquinone/menaquinone biosynthesis C-methylase UbiE